MRTILVGSMLVRLFWVAAVAFTLKAHPVQGAAFVANSPLQVPRAYHTTTLLQNGKLLVAGGYNGGPVAATELYDPATGMALTNGALGVARYQHTATLLPNGKVLVAGGLVAGTVPTNSAEVYDPVSASWSLTGAMHTARYYHTATLLTNGLVLVAGGEVGSSVVTNSAELYNPATGTWTLTGPMVQGRYADTATLLADGTVLATGGLTPGITPSTELYDPVAGTWSMAGSLNFDRSGHVAIRLASGQVLAAGGVFLGDITSAELYNPTTKAWQTTGSLNSTHVFDTASLLPNGEVLAVSGYYNSAASLTTNATEIYDPSKAAWTLGPPVQSGRVYHTATLLPGGEVVLVGGYNGTTYLSSIETLEQTNGYWSTTSPMSTGRYLPTLTLLTNGQVLAAGGAGNTNVPVNTELYNPAGGTWSATAGALNQGRYLHTATLLPNGQVLVTGGFDGDSYLASAELFDPATGLWGLTNAMHSTRAFHTATWLPNGKVLVAGGLNTNNANGTSELYDPVAGTWTLSGALNVPRSQHTATLLANGQVLVAGGYDTNYLQSVETYNPYTGTWSTNNPMNSIRAGHSATLLPNGQVLVAGGREDVVRHTVFLQSAELFNPANGTWTFTGPLNFAREYHTATLLPNGQVLVSGGDAGVALASSEVYNPATGTWSLTNALSTARSEAAAALLPNGRVLVAGGYVAPMNNTDLASAELFDPGAGFSPAWQPQVSGLGSPLTLATSLSVSGGQFRGISEASGGNASQDSPADYPLVQLRSMANEQSRFLPVTNWGTNSLTTVAVTNFPTGWALATVFANGIPSQSSFLEIQQGTATLLFSNLTQFFDFTARPVSVTTVPPGLAVTVTYDGSTAAPTNVGSYAVTATVNDPNYAGVGTGTLQVEFLRNYGVDASHFQNTNGIPLTNWAEMVEQGQRFAFIKATEGLTGANDPTMPTNVANASQAGLLVGVYHFAHPENRPTTNGAVQEADNFLNYAGSAIGPGRLRPVLDIETGNGTLTAAQMTDWVLAFEQEVESHRGAGAAPIVYCTQFYANNAFDSRLASNALWIEAGGGDDPTFANPPTNGFASATGIFSNWAFWQYNISGAAGGISPIDLDVCHDDFVPLNAYLIPTPAAGYQVQFTSLDGSGSHLALTNVPGTHFSLLSTTNILTPLSNWTVVGPFTEAPPGRFQVVDSGATNFAARFYRVSSP